MYESVVLSPRGKIAARLDGRFAEELAAALDRHPDDIILDMSRVTALDSPGIALILNARRSVAGGGGSFRVKGLNSRLRVIFEQFKDDRST